MKKFLSGNEAIARGAYEAGIHFATAYPGTPSTEILENISNYKEIKCQWAVNEKTSLEIAGGATFAGARAIVAMKHVGLNVAADPMFSLAYIGAFGALIIVTADDPSMHSSQNEQDNRYYARSARIPMFEPSDSQEAKDMIIEAVRLSEEWNLPVLIRMTTRVCHAKSIVELGERTEVPIKGYTKDISKRIVIPAHAKKIHVELEEKLFELTEVSSKSKFNIIEEGNPHIGVITSGVAYQYAKEVFQEASFMKIGFSYPLPMDMILDFIIGKKFIYIVEELEPIMENEIKALITDLASVSALKSLEASETEDECDENNHEEGCECEDCSEGYLDIPMIIGKSQIPRYHELSPDRLAEAVGDSVVETREPCAVPNRPPVLCPGCPHRGIFYAIKKQKLIATGDIGCYTLGMMPPLNALDTCVCMGASITAAFGIEKAIPELSKKMVAVIGDSTFFHSGMTGLLDVVYNQGHTTVLILDNRITAMTGHQDNPGSGFSISGQPAPEVDLEMLVKSFGVKFVKTVDPLNFEECNSALKEAVELEEPAVIITKRPCVLLKRYKTRFAPFKIDKEKCVGCQACVQVGCPAISYLPKEKKSEINISLCVGCGFCKQMCKFEAIEQTE